MGTIQKLIIIYEDMHVQLPLIPVSQWFIPAKLVGTHEYFVSVVNIFLL